MKQRPVFNLKKSDTYHGVYYDSEISDSKRWVARANRSCARFNHIGNFDTELEAAKAYNDYVNKHKLDMTLNDLENEAT